MAVNPVVKKDTWARSRRLELKHPGNLSFEEAINTDGTIDDEKGIEI